MSKNTCNRADSKPRPSRKARTAAEEIHLKHVKATGEIRRAGGPAAFLERVRRELSQG